MRYVPLGLTGYQLIYMLSVLLEGVTLMEIAIQPTNQSRWDTIMAAPLQVEGDQFPPELADAVQALWSDRGVQAGFKRRNELQLNDSAS
jgi:guanine nucleotide-binding protein G(i) subunit alpha